MLKDRRPLLKRGSRGQDVLDVQYDLDFVGADPPLVLDGIFGENTQAAVIDFQAANGLERDGIVGPVTRGALEASMREHDAPGALGRTPSIAAAARLTRRRLNRRRRAICSGSRLVLDPGSRL